jgi:hypothetical protein
MYEPGWVDHVRLQLEEEVDAGRRRISRERTEQFDLEVEAGRNWKARAEARFAAEVEAGRRTSARW